MSSTLATRLSVSLVATATDAAAVFGSESYKAIFPFIESVLTDGSTVNKANKVYVGTLTIGAGSSATLDLYGGLVDPRGNTLNLTRVVTRAVYNANTAVGDNLVLGAAASNPWESWTTVPGSTEKVGPGGISLKHEPSAAGMAVVNGASDNYKIANPGSNPITVYVMIVGS